MGKQESLFSAPEKRIGAGPVYQGVAKQIRELAGANVIDKGLMAGTIAQARSLARTIDIKSGHGGGDIEYGASIAALHKQLDELLERLGAADALDPFDELLDAIATDAS